MVTGTQNTHVLFADSEKFYFLGQSGQQVSPDALLGKVICLLYGAGWSPPFLEFLSLFKRFYSELESDHAPLQVIYVSFDRTREEMRELVSHFPASWVSLPHSSSLINYLKLKHSVVVIPRLVVVKDNGELITDKGVRDVRKRVKRCFTSWYNAAKILPVGQGTETNPVNQGAALNPAS